MRKTIEFNDDEVRKITEEGAKQMHRSFSACLRYCLREILSQPPQPEPRSAESPSPAAEGSRPLTEGFEEELTSAADKWHNANMERLKKKLNLKTGDQAPLSKDKQVKGFGKPGAGG